MTTKRSELLKSGIIIPVQNSINVDIFANKNLIIGLDISFKFS